MTKLLMREGSSWKVADRAIYCTSSVPPDIYTPGCTSHEDSLLAKIEATFASALPPSQLIVSDSRPWGRSHWNRE